MAFDQTTRNRLARFVSDARALLTEEFIRQLQNEYGLDPASGDVTPIERLTALDDRRRETARILRETMDYYLAGTSNIDGKAYRDVMDRIVREQAFTVVNRLCALRMSEARGLVLEAIAKGYQSKGFQLYARLAGSALGETGDAYRIYLFSLMDEIALDLPVLFDRFSPQGRLFPREAALLKLLGLINDPEIELLWKEDETIGWIYQYFNSKEERKAMRDASQAPRNSRELAVRNQFFTPRYVVEFLTDNTLGRIWYEMTHGETSLKETCHYLVRRPNEIFLNDGEEAPEQSESSENLSQEELLRQPVYIPYRPLKDPREIKMLDPACGSMHFGLYAFDLFEQIYAEAWDLEERLGEDALQRLADLESLHKTYPDKETFVKDVPRLIIERNIHGVDIDPRAVQIAGLSLWLRAQKSWQAQGLRPSERPQIRKSNVVCAEPMPGDRQMLEEFLSTLRGDGLEALMRKAWHIPAEQKVRATPQMADALAKLVRTVWDEMELAGEAGSLLKIEETLRNAIATARKESEEKSPLFRVLEYGLSESLKEKYVQVVAGEDQDFFDRAEGLVLSALKDYSSQAENGRGYRRGLFTEAAFQGFEFIDLCRKRYDVVVMNPPFGLVQPIVFEYLQKYFPDSYVDIYSSFVERGRGLLKDNGLVGAITSRTFIGSKKLNRWRANLIDRLSVLADFGLGVMDDALVRSSSYVLGVCPLKTPDIIFFDCQQNDDKKEVLIQNIENLCKNENRQGLFIRERSFFSKIPGQKLLYQASSSISEIFTTNISIEPTIATVRGGLRTFDDYRYLRLWWEVNPNLIGKNKKWERFAKGGEYSVFYTDIHLLINRENDGAELSETNRLINGQTAQSRQASSFYYRPGVQYTSRSAIGFSSRIIPKDCVWSSNAPLLLSESKITTAYLAGWLSSRLIRTLIEMQSTADDFIPGSIKSLPWKSPDTSIQDSIDRLSVKLYNMYHDLELWQETDPLFIGFSLSSSHTIRSLPSFDRTQREIIKSQIIDHQKEISKTIDELYAIESDEIGDAILERNVDEETPVSDTSLSISAKAVLSYVFGIVFGRWDLRVATGQEMVVKTTDPLEALPNQPPAIFHKKNNDNSTEHLALSYPVNFSLPDNLVDDKDHSKDIEGKIRECLAIIWGANFEEIEQEIIDILGVRSIRDYFCKPSLFFADHLKFYSKSRRVAPIYWPLSTPSCSYTLWLYYHRLNDQTLYTCVNDFVDPKLKQVSEEAARLRQKKGRSTADERELEHLTDFERELKDYREELMRIAKFWKPDLNDGVEITAAPLWKLFQYKPWQKRLKGTWEKLEAGEFDWAHLAYTIWPERVREKCKTDKSLAIAHGLEELYMEPPSSAKKKKAKKTTVDKETEGWFNDD